MSIFHRHSQTKNRRRSAQWMKELQIQSISENQYLKNNSFDLKAKVNSILSSQSFMIFMGLITIYSIFDIDVQKSFFDVNVCVYTSTLHAFCMALFFAQIIALIYSKDNYAFSFYFWIDVFSTLTMILELIWIQNLMSNSSNVAVAISLAKLTKASRLSKIGARSSKIMKLIRLMKFMKILNPQNNQQTAQNLNLKENQKAKNQNQHQIQYEYIENKSEFQIQKTERAIPHSKKLFEFKSSQVLSRIDSSVNHQIIQLNERSQNSFSISEQKDKVSTNNLVNMVFQTANKRASEQAEKNRKSSRSSRLSFVKRKQLMELNRIKQKEKRFKQINQNNIETPFSNMIESLQKNIYLPPIIRKRVDPILQQTIQEKYKMLLEKQNESNQKDKALLSGQNLKVGELLKQQIQKNIVLLVMGLIIAIPIITSSTWIDYEESLSLTSNLFFYGMNNLTNQALSDLVVNFIQVGLQVNTPLIYFDLPINQTCCQFPQDFPNYIQNTSFISINQLRLSQQSIIIDPNYNLTIIFSRRTIMSITSMLNVGRSFFITILLIFSSILFMKDIQKYALEPLQKMSNLINKISINPFQALKQINRQKQQQRKQDTSQKSLQSKQQTQQKQESCHKLQTNILQEVVIKITSLLALGAGEVGSQLISQNIEEVNPQNQMSQIRQTNQGSINKRHSIKGQKHVAIYVYMRFCYFQQICDIFGDSIFQFINLVTKFIHMNAIRYCGIPIQYDGQGFLLIWRPQETKQVFLDQSHYSLKSQIDTNLAKLSLLAMQFLTKATLDVSNLPQSKTLLNFLSQQSNFFQQNYQPHIFYSSIHVGQSIQGSMGSSFKLEYKCFGYDVSYTRYLTQLAQHYGVCNLISSDIIVLIQEYKGVIQEIGIRKIDQIKIKIIKQQEKKSFLEEKRKNNQQDKAKILQITQKKSSDLTYNSIYTIDFYVQANNFSEIDNNNQNNNRNQKKEKIITLKQKILQKNKKEINLEHYQDQNQSKIQKNNELAQKQSIQAYELRDVWQQRLKNSSVFQIHNQLRQYHKEQIQQSKKQFKQDFYQSWNDALECYFLKDLTQALHSFKSLHTYNSFYDYPSKIMIKRIQKLLQENDQKQWDSYEEVLWEIN